MPDMRAAPSHPVDGAARTCPGGGRGQDFDDAGSESSMKL
jgi:hypothetical protein